MRKSLILSLTISLVILFVGVVYAVDPLFGTNVDYGAGGCISVLAIDLDGDDDIDLVTAGSILLNNGDGTFQTAVSYDAGGGAESIFSADLDGDGDNDLATLHYIILNNGDGTFQEPVDFSYGYLSQSISGGDIDGDGDIDLAVTDMDISSPSHVQYIQIYKNNGDGTFQLPEKLYLAYYISPHSVFIIDLDADGDNDMVATAQGVSLDVLVYINNGAGDFQRFEYDSGTIGTVFSSINSIDLDGDSDNDLAVGNFDNGNISVMLNNGDGSFQAGVVYDAGGNPWSICSADLDEDGDNDLISNVSYLLNNGDGTFQTAIVFGTSGALQPVFSADFDGDGDNDLVAKSTEPDNISVWMNLTNPGWVCGDIDDMEGINILDIVALINYEYKNQPLPGAMNAANVDGISPVNILDIVYLINNIYKGGPTPACL
ncbi:MAG: VCBS repeat-containing protein [candidate division Zixibacteria bacterium]|nr:VCBS repeat-containing protein [candidate division Zixibacteria bacterium]